MLSVNLCIIYVLKNSIMDELIIEAIENKNLLEFYYKNHHRIVEPHTFGVSTKGNNNLSAYQIDGTSDSGVVPDWKLFTVSKIKGLQVLEDTFAKPRNGYTTGDSRMEIIYAEI